MRYEVLYKQLNLFKIWEGLEIFPKKSTVVDGFPNLEKAVKWMDAFDLLCFSPDITHKIKLPVLITDMAIITLKGELVATKSYLRENPPKGTVEGVHLHVNTDHISLTDFEKQSKLDLSAMINTNKDGATFLAATKADLERMLRNELKIRATSKNIRNTLGRGMSFN